MNKFTTEYFITRAKKIHGDQYDYSEVVYTKSAQKVKIFCKKCKKFFEQTPHHHLRGTGCPYCQGKHKSTEDFIYQAKTVHGDKYDYSETIYNGAFSKIKIYCKTCKRFFLQRASAHLCGQGCSRCQNHNYKTQNGFIEYAKIIHGDCYNYDQVDYQGICNKVKIFCKKCKKFFEQTPRDHLQGCGCPSCNFSKGELQIKQILEQNQIKFQTQKRFEDCKYKMPLPFDFYLPDYNMCIEYQGQQHYSSAFHIGILKDVSKGKKAFMEQKKRDNIKRCYCRNKNINLLEIKYTDNIYKKIKNAIQLKE